MTFHTLIDASQHRVDAIFKSYIKCKAAAPILNEAIEYALYNGGKRIRPLLVYVAGYSLKVDMATLDVAAAAVELIHAYSLIHDDLPAMDNANLRRGKPANHKQYGEAIAILAGDAMQPLAFQLLSDYPAKLTPDQRLKMVQILAKASGTEGMAAGQTQDIIGCNTLNELTHMYQLKTGALLKACVQLACAASSREDALPLLERYAENIGLAFQIQDDLLDMNATAEKIGKPIGLDDLNQKVTYARSLGFEKAKEYCNQLINIANEAVTQLERDHVFKQYSELLLNRQS